VDVGVCVCRGVRLYTCMDLYVKIHLCLHVHICI